MYKTEQSNLLSEEKGREPGVYELATPYTQSLHEIYYI